LILTRAIPPNSFDEGFHGRPAKTLNGVQPDMTDESVRSGS
jgi:hypothetical protein